MSALSSTKLCVGSAVAALFVVALGCGGDSTDTGSGGSGGSGGTTGSGASGGSGGSTTGGSGGSTTGGTGGSGGTGGTGGVPDGGDVICGGTTCTPSPLGLPSCCTMQNTCGTMVGLGGSGFCVDPTGFDAGAPPEAGTGVPDPNCASVMIGGFSLSGCCMPDNTCGFSSQFFPGCVTYDQLRMFPGVNLPEGGPMSCIFPPPRL